MKIKEKQLIKKEVIIGYKCDACKKEVKLEGYPPGWFSFIIGLKARKKTIRLTPGFFDDEESKFDVCSAKCFIKQLKKQAEKALGLEFGGTITDMNRKSAYKTIAGMDMEFIQDLIRLYKRDKKYKLKGKKYTIYATGPDYSFSEKDSIKNT